MEIRSGELDREHLKGTINIFYQTGSEACDEIPFPHERCLRTCEEILMKTHLSLLTENFEDDY